MFYNVAATFYNKLHDVTFLMCKHYQLCNKTANGLTVYSRSSRWRTILCSAHVSPTGDHLFNFEVP